MAFIEQIIEGVKQNVSSFSIDTVNLLPNLITALAIFFIGIFVGKLTKWLLKLILVKIFKLGALIKVEVIDAFTAIIKWIIYIVFFQSAITILGIPVLTQYLGTALGIIGGLIGSIVILMVGYALANFLKLKLEETKLGDIDILGKMLFLFIIYVALVLAVESALVSFGEKSVAPNVILVLTTLFAATIAWHYKDYGKKGRK
jgi:hypothetical protein